MSMPVAVLSLSLDEGERIIEPGEGEPALELLERIAARAEVLHRAGEALDEGGWQVEAQLLVAMVAMSAVRGFDSLEDALEDAAARGVPAGTAVEWCVPPSEPGRVPIAHGGAFIGGPWFGEGSVEETLVMDVYGRESVHRTRAEGLAAVVEAIREYATELARLYPDADLSEELYARADELDELPPQGLDLRLIDDELERRVYGVKAMPADYFRWDGFKLAVKRPEEPEQLRHGSATLAWGPVARRLAMEGWSLATQPGAGRP
jgi:hypothetical protein